MVDSLCKDGWIYKIEIMIMAYKIMNNLCQHSLEEKNHNEISNICIR